MGGEGFGAADIVNEERQGMRSVLIVDSAKVVTTDIVVSNGVIHVIDSVMLPK